MINMRILKAGDAKFTGSSGGKPIRSIYMAHEGADALVLMTAHREFRDQSHASGGRVQHFGWTILG
ncbi:MAG: hypothetical protein KJ714_06305 [Euryarchaeota archaeon]|nr:hypothetical protein [Euryarchaeota archaeon]